ncbi:hypothetical protein GCM10009706_28000 [Curtobacterium citreum]|uniref:Uncharacterized protein n=1 Tax=Curtobacterium citreum TaxID=2036 RepID=A0ABT2HKA9_9MICO|nr:MULTISPECIES: hypothetical protein [Curtobacterium]MCS6523713.1 hypothetical protein [Curtobacterium citreum]RDH95464.1 hypothetical protein DEU32_1123 [Curtobacterium sp. AG1037]TQJ26494.1 hypothetical protein FB462_0329 [Curtobacterium citreum]GGL87769.1 hypothetical protein GCM10009706_28000 [Curtobacterium citreum]
MKLIQSTNRGIAVVGPGYFRGLKNQEELQAATMAWGQPVIGNDRQFDVWKAIALQGTTA